MGNINFITKYRTFDIKINKSGRLFVAFDPHLLNRTPYEFNKTFDIVSEAKDAIDKYWRIESRHFMEGMLN